MKFCLLDLYKKKMSRNIRNAGLYINLCNFMKYFVHEILPQLEPDDLIKNETEELLFVLLLYSKRIKCDLKSLLIEIENYEVQDTLASNSTSSVKLSKLPENKNFIDSGEINEHTGQIAIKHEKNPGSDKCVKGGTVLHACENSEPLFPGGEKYFCNENLKNSIVNVTTTISQNNVNDIPIEKQDLRAIPLVSSTKKIDDLKVDQSDNSSKELNLNSHGQLQIAIENKNFNDSGLASTSHSKEIVDKKTVKFIPEMPLGDESTNLNFSSNPHSKEVGQKVEQVIPKAPLHNGSTSQKSPEISFQKSVSVISEVPLDDGYTTLMTHCIPHFKKDVDQQSAAVIPEVPLDNGSTNLKSHSKNVPDQNAVSMISEVNLDVGCTTLMTHSIPHSKKDVDQQSVLVIPEVPLDNGSTNLKSQSKKVLDQNAVSIISEVNLDVGSTSLESHCIPRSFIDLNECLVMKLVSNVCYCWECGFDIEKYSLLQEHLEKHNFTAKEAYKLIVVCNKCTFIAVVPHSMETKLIECHNEYHEKYKVRDYNGVSISYKDKIIFVKQLLAAKSKQQEFNFLGICLLCTAFFKTPLEWSNHLFNFDHSTLPGESLIQCNPCCIAIIGSKTELIKNKYLDFFEHLEHCRGLRGKNYFYVNK